ncbi:MAG: two pore domain potassium channel family protein [Cellulosilyticum sp.]|nr:two pore domain potassium channel family protein [Cellulosilyticum sp.]
MLIYLLIAVIGVQLIRSVPKQSLSFEDILTYLMPYWKKGNTQDRILEVLQLFIIGCIGILEAFRTQGNTQKLCVFLLTFITLVWLVKLLLCIIEWFQEYIKTMSINILFALVVPIIVSANLKQLDDQIEISLCLCALFMSLMIVYMELISIVIGKGTYKRTAKYLSISSASKLKSILTWFFIILVNLYTLVLFIQFYIETSSYHFIETKALNKASAIDLFYYLIVTFTTVGFGDISPHTLLAKMVTALIALSGMIFTGIFVGCILNLTE